MMDIRVHTDMNVENVKPFFRFLLQMEKIAPIVIVKTLNL